ncbi:MAG TPA: metal ABC transporter permease [Pirellulales bacterium]
MLKLFSLAEPQALWTIAVAAVAGASCAILGCYLVLRRMSLLGDAISHAVLPGIALGFLIGGTTTSAWIFVCAAAVGLLTAFLIQTLTEQGQIAEDSSMGVVFTSLFAFGVVLIALVGPRVDLDLDCVLYGLLELVTLDTVPILGVEAPRAMISLAAVFCLTVVFVATFWKELKIVSFDPQLADAMGLRAAVIHYLLMGMVALAVVAAFNAVGSVLVLAMLVVPAATGHLLSDRLGRMMAWAVAAAVVSAVMAYAGDVNLGVGMAPMLPLAAGALFATALLLAPRHGLVSRVWHRLSLAVRIKAEDVIAALYRDEESGGKAAPGWTVKHGLAVAGRGPLAWLALGRLWLHREATGVIAQQMRLTERGREAARSLIRSHRLWESYLGEHFDLPLDHLHEPAERIEHYIGPSLREQLASELARPGLDPHGKQIPPEAR